MPTNDFQLGVDFVRDKMEGQKGAEIVLPLSCLSGEAAQNGLCAPKLRD